MGTRASLSEDELYAFWWLHDARWYQEVAKQFGTDAANELNRKSLRFLAARVAEALRSKSSVPVEDMTWAQVVELFSQCAEVMWPDIFVKFESTVLDENHFAVDMTHNFSLEMLRRANSLDTYDCACLQIREGWFKGLGLTKLEDTVTCCIRDGATTCHFDARVERTPAT